MPVNKAARIRFEILDECLRNTRKKWTKAELLHYVNRRLTLSYGDDHNISASQLRYDLADLETEFGAPVEMYRDGRNYYYRYTDDAFSIRNIPIQDEDIQILTSAVSLLRQIRGFSIADEIEDVVKKLESRYRFPGQGGRPVIAFEDSPPITGIENLEDIYHAILRQTPLKLEYQSFRAKEPRQFHLHPYLLKEFAQRWYLLGYCEEKQSVTTFALDRIGTIKVAARPFIPNTFIDGNNYFRDVIGVTIYSGQQPEQIELLFAPFMAPYLQTKPLHHSQQILQQYDDGSLLIRVHLMINPELLVELLGYGSNVTVLAPQSLADAMQAEIRKMTAQYQSRPGVAAPH